MKFTYFQPYKFKNITEALETFIPDIRIRTTRNEIIVTKLENFTNRIGELWMDYRCEAISNEELIHHLKRFLHNELQILPNIT